jgi:hypothetical protein
VEHFLRRSKPIRISEQTGTKERKKRTLLITIITEKNLVVDLHKTEMSPIHHLQYNLYESIQPNNNTIKIKKKNE